MSKQQLTPRQRQRLKKNFPFGICAALLTGAAVVLVGVFLKLEPYVILQRAVVSSFVLGIIVSLGVSIIRMTDSEYRQHAGRRRATNQRG